MLRKRWFRWTVAAACLLFLLLAVLYFALVQHIPPPTSPRPAQRRTADLRLRLAPRDDVPMRIELETAVQHSGYATREGRLRVQRAEATEPHDAVFTLYQVAGQMRRPAVIVTPILGGDNQIARIIASDLAQHGFHVVIVDRVRLEGLSTIEMLEVSLRDMVADRMRVIDWLTTLPHIASEAIGAYGVSMGGMTTTLLAGVDPRVKAAVIPMAGGNIGQLLVRSVERECREFRTSYGLDANANEEKIAAFSAHAHRVLQTDPLQLAAYVETNAVLMFTTRFDRSVPSDLQLALWQTLGKPERYTLPTGHYSAMIYLPFMRARARSFLALRLKGPSE